LILKYIIGYLKEPCGILQNQKINKGLQMNEELERKAPRILPMGFKVNEDEKKVIVDFINKKNWKMSAFLRRAVMREIKRLKNEV